MILSYKVMSPIQDSFYFFRLAKETIPCLFSTTLYASDLSYCQYI